MIGIIAACSINGIIGIIDPVTCMGKLPFNYPDDMRYFRQTTKDSVVIMGRKTFESIGSKPLPKRDNYVITSQKIDDPQIKCFPTIHSAISYEKSIIREHPKNIWLIGGASIYEEGMLYADEIHLTLTPDYISEQNNIKFPFINPMLFELKGYMQLSDPPSDKLVCAIYKRNKSNHHYEKVVTEMLAHKSHFKDIK